MYLLKINFTFLLQFLVFCICAQSNFLPKNLGPAVNSTEYAEINPVISPNGKILYFTRVSHPENNHQSEEHFGPDDSQDIWYSLLQADGSWSQAKRLNFLNLSVYNALLSISDDGKTILLNGIYDKKNRWIKRGLSICTGSDTTWSSPMKLDIVTLSRKNKGSNSNAFLTGDGKMLFFSYSKRFNSYKQKIYYSLNEDGDWQKPVPLPKNINIKGLSNESPYFNVESQNCTSPAIWEPMDQIKKNLIEIFILLPLWIIV